MSTDRDGCGVTVVVEGIRVVVIGEVDAGEGV